MSNRSRIVGLVLLVVFATWWSVRGCTRQPEVRQSQPTVARETFRFDRPVQVEVIATRLPNGAAAETDWLELELRRALLRPALRIAPAGQGDSAREAFLLRIAVAPDFRQVSLALVAPDQILEREQTILFKDSARSAIARSLAAEIPKFLGAPTPADASVLPGLDDPNGYEIYTRAAVDLLGADGAGFTQPPAEPSLTRTVERLEALTRSRPRFARAWALLALAYLGLGGEDEISLTELAKESAERAAALDGTIADAHAALGLAALRRNEWTAAHEQLRTALMIDPHSAPALEGLACLFTDAGLYRTARTFASRAVALQPRSLGANEYLAYASEGAPVETAPHSAAAQILALRTLLNGDAPGAAHALRDALRPAQFDLWAQPLLLAIGDARRTPAALRAITRAASDGQIAPYTEIVCGAGLRQADFVLNRIARLQRKGVQAPLRILWLPQTAFLRRHARFKDVIGASGLSAFWQENGLPDVCASESAVYGCAMKEAKNR
ncbi:MAG TPA: hypothetical protein VHK24_14140 [Steroidobacter sp.]|nr:hypothetical protein [Steroidobacter sp.]